MHSNNPSIRQAAQNLETELQERLAIETSAVSRRPDVDDCVSAMLKQSWSNSVRSLPDKVATTVSELNSDCGAAAAETLLRLVATRLAADVMERSKGLPESVRSVLAREVTRIVEGLRGNTVGQHVPENDVFIKDLKTLTLRMVPCGARLVDRSSGISRKVALTGGVRQALAALSLYVRMRGFSPLFELHTHAPTLFEFNEAGFVEAYCLIAELLEQSPKVRGVFAVSWFYDPVVEEISPRLAYVRHLPCDNGASLLRIGSTESSVRLATEKSATRRRLVESGKYLPTLYMFVWPREKMIAWANRNRHDSRGVKH